MFCCTDFGSNRIVKPQSPLFTKNSKPYPCVDHTSHCQRWIRENPNSCSPDHENKDGFSSYPFMREVCLETCNQKLDNFRSNRCKNVTELLLHLTVFEDLKTFFFFRDVSMNTKIALFGQDWAIVTKSHNLCIFIVENLVDHAASNHVIKI